MIDIFILNLLEFNERLAKNGLPLSIQSRADSYTLNKKKKEFIASQWLRFYVLSKALNCSFKQLNFAYSDKGRPYLTNTHKIDFNISHTDKYVVITVAKGNIKVGIDVQKTKEKIDTIAIAKQYYTKQESQQLTSLEKIQQLDYFYQLWIHKEASLKLTGQGIAHGLEQFSFNYDNGRLTPYSCAAKKVFYYASRLDENTVLCLAYDNEKAKKNLNFIYLY